MVPEAQDTSRGDHPIAAQDSGTRRVVSPVLVGRDAELSAVLSALAAPPAVALLEGEAGVGKTRLVTELLGRVEMSTLRRLLGRCHPIREPFPLGPAIEAVRGLGAELGGLKLNPVAGALRPLLPELSHLLPPALEPLDDRAAQRHRVFRGLVEILAAAGPAVLVVEDAHWADQQTADFLTYLIAELPPLLAVVLTYRGEEASPAIRALPARRGADVTQARVGLTPLDEDRTGALIAAILGVDTVSAEFSAYLWQRTSGLPLAIEGVLALVRSRGLVVRHGGRWERKALDEIEVPSGIRDSTLERVARLSASARRVVRACAVLQALATVDVLHGMVDQAEILEGYDEAVESGLLTEISGKVGFRHALAAEAVYADLGTAGKRWLHSKAADALLASDVVPLGQAAHHLRLAGRLDEWASTAEQAADRATELGDDAEVTRLLDVVLREAPLSHEQRGQIAVKLGRAATQTLHTQDLVGLLSGVLEQELPQVVRGELRYLLVAALHQNGDGDLHLHLNQLSQAIDELDDRPDLKARALVALGLVAWPLSGDTAAAVSAGWIERSLALAGEIGDAELEQFVAGKAGSALIRDGDPDWRRMVDRTMAINGAPRHRDEVNLYWTLGSAALYIGHFTTAARLLADGERASAALGLPRLESIIRVDRAFLSYRRGQWTGLAAQVDGLIAELADARGYRLAAETAAACLALAGGAVDEAQAQLEDTLEAAFRFPDLDPIPVAGDAAVRAALHRGDVDSAVALARGCVSRLTDKGDWLHAVQFLPAAVSALMPADRQAEARDLIDRAQRALRNKDAPLGPACVRHAVGLLTASAEDLHAAAEMYEADELPYDAARADEQAARCLLERGDTNAATPVLRSVVAAYDRLGASWDRARAAGLARQYDVGLPAVHRGGHRGYGARLSPREREVAALAAAGRTNNEIAADLFVTRYTVEKHLGAAMRKLNLRSRTELARQWDHIADADVPTSESGGYPP